MLAPAKPSEIKVTQIWANRNDSRRVERFDGIVAALDMIDIDRVAHTRDGHNALQIGGQVRIVGDPALVALE